MADAISPDTTQAQKVVTPEMLQGLSQQLTEVTGRIDAQSKYIAKLEGQIKEAGKVKEPDVKTDPLTDRVKALETSEKRGQAREEKQKEREAEGKIADALINQDVEPTQARRLAKLVYSEQKEIIKFDDDLTPTVQDGEKTVPLSDWMNAYFQTTDGKTLLPPKRNPTSDVLNGRRGSLPTGVRQVTSADLAAGRVDLKDLREGKVVVTDAPF